MSTIKDILDVFLNQHPYSHYPDFEQKFLHLVSKGDEMAIAACYFARKELPPLSPKFIKQAQENAFELNKTELSALLSHFNDESDKDPFEGITATNAAVWTAAACMGEFKQKLLIEKLIALDVTEAHLNTPSKWGRHQQTSALRLMLGHYSHQPTQELKDFLNRFKFEKLNWREPGQEQAGNYYFLLPDPNCGENEIDDYLPLLQTFIHSDVALQIELTDRPYTDDAEKYNFIERLAYLAAKQNTPDPIQSFVKRRECDFLQNEFFKTFWFATYAGAERNGHMIDIRALCAHIKAPSQLPWDYQREKGDQKGVSIIGNIFNVASKGNFANLEFMIKHLTSKIDENQLAYRVFSDKKFRYDRKSILAVINERLRHNPKIGSYLTLALAANHFKISCSEKDDLKRKQAFDKLKVAFDRAHNHNQSIGVDHCSDRFGVTLNDQERSQLLNIAPIAPVVFSTPNDKGADKSSPATPRKRSPALNG